jgi:LysR family nitrogen assimilation transcriptional regulator
MTLLHRSARGAKPTIAGEVLYREASAILRQMDQLPGIVRSREGEVEGSVSLGMSSTLAATLAGGFIEACRTALPKVMLKFSASDSESLKARVVAQTLDMALVFEDELVPNYARSPLFRQRLFLVGRKPPGKARSSISLKLLADVPLVLPSQSNITRRLLDREFAAAGIVPNIVAEGDVLSSILPVVKTGIGHTIIPTGDLADVATDDFAAPIPIEPPLYLTASVVSSPDFPLTRAGESVRSVLQGFLGQNLRGSLPPGAEWIGERP